MARGDGATVWLPAGAHTVETAPASSGPACLSTSMATFAPPSAPAILASICRTNVPRGPWRWWIASPPRLEIDGADAPLTFLASGTRYSILLPRGQHLVTIHTE